jgi:hypothetical protein
MTLKEKKFLLPWCLPINRAGEFSLFSSLSSWFCWGLFPVSQIEGEMVNYSPSLSRVSNTILPSGVGAVKKAIHVLPN